MGDHAMYFVYDIYSTEGYQVIMWPLCYDYECDEHLNVNMTITCDKLSLPVSSVTMLNKWMETKRLVSGHSLLHWLESPSTKLNISSLTRPDQEKRGGGPRSQVAVWVIFYPKRNEVVDN